jgi:hypothetical protein
MTSLTQTHRPQHRLTRAQVATARKVAILTLCVALASGLVAHMWRSASGPLAPSPASVDARA